MDLLSRFRRREPDRPEPPVVAGLRVLRASGQRIDLSARDVGMRIAATRQSWQADAWDYHGRIGELAYALRLLAQQVAKVRFYAAEIRPYPDDPIELTSDDCDVNKQLAADAVGNLARLPLDDESVDGFIATLCRNLNVAGEAFIHGRPEGTDEEWLVRSVSEVIAQGDEVYLAELPTSTTIGRRRITESEALMRCWIRHPRWAQLADSPLSSTVDVLEGIVLDSREGRVASQSRIAANGIILVPSDLSLTRIREDVEGLRAETITDDELMMDLVEAMTAPIRNEGHPGAVVPMMLRGSAESLKEVRHLKIDRADPEKLSERISSGLVRMLRSIDIQPEQVEGISQSNHWCVDDRTEILTDCGWVTQDAVRVGMRVLTLNHQTGLSQWQPVRDIYRSAVANEPMVLIEGRSHSSLSTPDHRWPVTKVRQRQGERFVAREFARTATMDSEHSIVTGAPCGDLPSVPKYTDDLVELVGWFWTEGSVRADGRVSIAQSHTKNAGRVERIRTALTRLLGPPVSGRMRNGYESWREHVQLNKSSYGGPVTVFSLNREASALLTTVAPNKRVGFRFLTDLTPAQLDLFINVSCMGDGWHYRAGILDIWQRTESALAAFELALILSGRGVTWGTASGGHWVRAWRQPSMRPVKAAVETRAIGGGRRKGRDLREKTTGTRMESVRYTGTIWCPVTANGTWLARRRGTVYYTGNSAWAVDAKDVRQQVAPWSATIAGCITKAYLRESLKSIGWGQDQIRNIGVWYDVSGLAENPNRGQDARDAHSALVISDAALRRSLGFDDDDAPGEEELQRRIAARAGVDQGTAALFLEMARAATVGRPQVIEVQRGELPAGSRNGDGAHPARPGDTVPEKPVPDEPAEPGRGMTAAAAPDLGGWRVDTVLAGRLVEIDVVLAERILTAADAAVARAVERAGGRARSALRAAANGDESLAAAIGGVDAVLIPGRVGRDVLLAAVGLPQLLADAYTRLREQFLGWLDQAAQQVATVVVRMLGLPGDSPRGRDLRDVVTTRFAVHRDRAWVELSAALDDATERALFRADPLTPDPAPGEGASTLLAPAAVAAVLTTAGGGPPGVLGAVGLGAGAVAHDVLTERGAVRLGWEWQYRPERPRAAHFGPHLALDGVRFVTWDDPRLATGDENNWVGTRHRPGDHAHCRCAVRPVIAVPVSAGAVTGDAVVGRLRRRHIEGDGS